jgi:hypothetical protein
MPRGGARPGAGRPKGSTAWKALINKPLLNGVTALQFMQSIYRTPEAPPQMRFMAAKEALPYEERKLAPLPAPKGEDRPGMTPDEEAWEADVGLRPN